jgi:hypothetical protein
MKKKTAIPLIILFSLMFLVLAAGILIRNIVLSQVRGQIEASFQYSRIQVSFFPPSLVIENLRSKSGSPSFSARSVRISISYPALLSTERPVSVLLEEPNLRFTEAAPRSGRPLKVELPFSVEKGLIRNGELFWRGNGRIRASGLNAAFTWRKTAFEVQGRAREALVVLPGSQQALVGQLQLHIQGRPNRIRIRRLVASGPSLYLKAEGEIQQGKVPAWSLEGDFSLRAAFIAEIFRLPFQWDGETRGTGRILSQGDRLSIEADLDSRDLKVNRVPLGKVQGKLDVKAEKGGVLNLTADSGAGRRQVLHLSFSGSRVEGRAEGLALDPVMNEIRLPWPVRSPAWGRFVLQDGRLEVEAEFRDDSLVRGAPPEERFPVRGPFTLSWDGGRQVHFESKEFESSFGRQSLEADIVIGQTFDMHLAGEVRDVSQARQFTSLLLAEEFDIPEIRGRGNADIRISGAYDSPRIQSKFFLFPGALDKLEAAFVEGTADIQGHLVTVHCRADDPQLMGQVDFHTESPGWMARIKLNRGSVQRIFPALDIPLDLRGDGQGQFEVRGQDGRLQVTGDFSSPELKLAGQSFREVKGQLDWKDDTLQFPALQGTFRGGRVTGAGTLGLASDEFDLRLTGEGIDLASFAAGFNGRAFFDLAGRGIMGRDALTGNLEVRNLGYGSLQAGQAGGKAEIRFSGQKVDGSWKGLMRPEDNDFNLTFSYQPPDGIFAADIKGSFVNLDLLLPWQGVKGRLNYLAEVRSPSSGTGFRGVVDFQGPVLPIPKFAQALNDYSGLIFIEGRHASLRSFKATLGGGPVQGSGEVDFRPEGGPAMDVALEGKGIQLYFLERAKAVTDGWLRLIRDAGQFALEGDFQVSSLSWRRELDEKFFFSSSAFYQPSPEKGFFDDLTLNIRLRAEDNSWVDNSLGRVRTRFDLTISGNVNSPILLGEITALGGTVNFQDRKFNLLRGTLRFFNPLAVDPYLDFKGEAYVKDYRVTFTLTGLLDHLKPEFSSSPPLPPEDVLALLAMGESFKRTYRAETSTQLSSATLLTFQLSEEAKKRARKLLSVDRFRIDPFILGSSSEMTARLTVGKKVTKDLFIFYSTNLTTQREEIIRLEWELANNLSVVGIRDELGRMSFDIKLRKRF